MRGRSTTTRRPTDGALEMSSVAATPDRDLGGALSELVNLMLTTPSIEGFLGETARLAAGVADALDCGITLRRDQGPCTVASHGTLAAVVDEQQYGEGDGPCLQALRTGHVVEVVDVAQESRWGAYPALAMRHGVRSSLSLPLVVDGDPRGAVNLYAAVSHAFDAAARCRALAFSEQAAAALTVVSRQAQLTQLTEQLQAALASRSVIDQAIGIIVGRDRCSPDDAFALLRTTSQHQNRKLREIAADLVAATAGPPPGSAPDGVAEHG